MESIGVKRNNFSFDLSLAIRKPDLGMITIWHFIKEKEKADESHSYVRGRPFHLRNPVSVLKLQRDLEKLKQQNESPSDDDVNASTSGGCAFLSPHAKVDKLFKNLVEFRKQLTRAMASLLGSVANVI
ncbi:unnamed protein product [Orchesella dallaii]|uniref:Uncharacterized protein n=1 Tax=Orchesella dallaii TaxID=48710 RepID=A0ABP1R4D8_9HEXA